MQEPSPYKSIHKILEDRDLTTPESKIQAITQLLEENPDRNQELLDEQNQYGITPILRAAEGHHLAEKMLIVDFLAGKGANVQATDTNGFNLAYYLAPISSYRPGEQFELDTIKESVGLLRKLDVALEQMAHRIASFYTPSHPRSKQRSNGNRVLEELEEFFRLTELDLTIKNPNGENVIHILTKLDARALNHYTHLYVENEEDKHNFSKAFFESDHSGNNIMHLIANHGEDIRYKSSLLAREEEFEKLAVVELLL